MKTLLLLLWMTLVAWSAKPWSQGIHYFGPQAGLEWLHNKDEVASPLIYGGNTIPFGASYRYIGERHSHLVGFRAYFAELESTGPSESLRIRTDGGFDSEYAYLVRMMPWSKGSLRHRMDLGPAWRSRLDLREYEFGYLAWEGYSSLDAALRWTSWLSDRNRLGATARIPLLAWISRPPYALENNETLEAFGDLSEYAWDLAGFATWPELKRLDAALTYGIRIAGPMWWELEYHWMASEYTEPRPTILQETGFATRLLWGL